MLTDCMIGGFDKELGNSQGDWETFPVKTPSQGVATHVFAAFDPTLKGLLFLLVSWRMRTDCTPESNGRYLSDVQVVDLDELHPHAISSREAKKLWKLSEQIVGQKFDL